MNPLIIDSIRHKRRLRFTYHGKSRLVEPQCYGVGTRGAELLRAHQIDGGALFDVAQISELVVLDEHFTKPGPHYKAHDSAMASIYCQL